MVGFCYQLHDYLPLIFIPLLLSIFKVGTANRARCGIVSSKNNGSRNPCLGKSKCIHHTRLLHYWFECALRCFKAIIQASSGKERSKKEVVMVDPLEAKRLAAKQMEQIKTKEKFKKRR